MYHTGDGAGLIRELAARLEVGEPAAAPFPTCGAELGSPRSREGPTDPDAGCQGLPLRLRTVASERAES